MKTIRYAAIGDIGIDIYPKLGKRFPGGMALNSAYHAHATLADSSVVSAVGDDAEARFIRNFLKKNTILAEALEVVHGKTDTVEITLDARARPQYGTWNLGVLTKYRLTKKQKQYLHTQDTAVAVHLPQLRRMFDDFASLTLPHTLKVADFTDLSEHKGNQDILREYVDCFNVFALSIDEKIEERLDSFEEFVVKNSKIGVALLGEKGSKVFHNRKQYAQHAIKTNIVDTTGAGDAYLATFLVEYFQDMPISYAMKKATNAASWVIQKYGAVQL